MPPKNDPSPFSLVIVDFDNTLTLEENAPWMIEPKIYPANFELLQILYEHHANTGVPIQIVSAGAKMWHYIQTDATLETCPFFVVEPFLVNAFHYVASRQEIVDQSLIQKTIGLYRGSFIEDSISSWLSLSQETLLDTFKDPILYNYIAETHALLCFFYRLCAQSYDLYHAYGSQHETSFDQVIEKRLIIMSEYGKNLMLVHAYLQRTIATGSFPNACLMQQSVFLIDDNSMVIEKADSFCQVIQYNPLEIENIHPQLKAMLSKAVPLHTKSLEKNPKPQSILFMAAYTDFSRELHQFDQSMQDTPHYPLMVERLTFLANYLDMPCVHASENIHYLYHLVLFEQSILETEYFEPLKNSPYSRFLTNQQKFLERLIFKPKAPLQYLGFNQTNDLVFGVLNYEKEEEKEEEKEDLQKREASKLGL